MLTLHERQAILALKARDLSNRGIARAMKISRTTVESVLATHQVEVCAGVSVPEAIREAPGLELVVRELFKRCRGFVTRVVECLQEEHSVTIPYSTMTRYVSQLGLRGKREGQISREIVTGPGAQMQHDTSPITVVLGGKRVKLELAELVYCFSRHRYLEFFPKWQRFHLKVFMTRAIQYLGGACRVGVVDNSRLIVILGAGPDGTIAPEMERFGELFGFRWRPIPLGQKDWNGKVEKAHQFVQTNFLPGRTFRDLADLNAQLADWRDKIFGRPVSGQDFAPTDRWPEECAHLEPLPLYVPEMSRTWSGKRVDDYGWLWLHGSKYSVPDRFALELLTIRETGDELIVFLGSQEVCRHRRFPECERGNSRLPGHHPRHSPRAPARNSSAEERHLRSLGPEVERYLDDLSARPIRYSYARLRRLYRFSCNYPQEIFLATLADALERRAFDLTQLEKILEERMGHRILESRLASDAELEKRPAYRKGQVTPHRLRPVATPPLPIPEHQVGDHQDGKLDEQPERKEEHDDSIGTVGANRGSPQAVADELKSGGAAGDSQSSAQPAENLQLVAAGTSGARGEGA